MGRRESGTDWRPARITGLLLLLFGLTVAAQDGTQMPTLAELQKMPARFAPADIGADITAQLPSQEE